MMQLDHERLDVYDLALEFLVLANGIVEGLPRGRSHNGAVRVAARPAGRGARGPGPAPQTSAYQQKRAQRLLTDRRARARARLRARASDPNSGTRPSPRTSPRVSLIVSQEDRKIGRSVGRRHIQTPASHSAAMQ